MLSSLMLFWNGNYDHSLQSVLHEFDRNKTLISIVDISSSASLTRWRWISTCNVTGAIHKSKIAFLPIPINKNDLYSKEYNSYVTIIHYTSNWYKSMLLWLSETKFPAQNGNYKLNISENMLQI